MTDPKTEPRLVEAFQLMWGNYPDPMMLVRRDRTILAVNDAYAAQGGEAGQRCFSRNPDPAAVEGGACKGCQANAALKQGSSITCEGDLGGKRIRGYWIPVRDSRDVYVHGYSTVGAALPTIA